MPRRLGVLLALLVAVPLAAQAAPITYTYAGTATGSLDGVAFTDTAYVITAQADTANIGAWCCSPLQNTHLSATIQLDGFGTLAFNVATQTWRSNNTQRIGFGLDLDGNLITLTEPAFTGWNLDTAIGPVVEAAPELQAASFTNLATTGGALTFGSIGSVTFRAFVDGNRIPEPSTLGLAALLLIGIGATRRQRRAI